jgi:hypothetical protein
MCSGGGAAAAGLSLHLFLGIICLRKIYILRVLDSRTSLTASTTTLTPASWHCRVKPLVLVGGRNDIIPYIRRCSHFSVAGGCYASFNIRRTYIQVYILFVQQSCYMLYRPRRFLIFYS